MPFVYELTVWAVKSRTLYGGIACQSVGPVGGGISKQWGFRQVLQGEHLNCIFPSELCDRQSPSAWLCFEQRWPYKEEASSGGAGWPQQLLCAQLFKLPYFTPSRRRKQQGGGVGKCDRKVLFMLVT